MCYLIGSLYICSPPVTRCILLYFTGQRSLAHSSRDHKTFLRFLLLIIRPLESDKWASLFLFLQTEFLLEVREQAKIWQSKPFACSANTANTIKIKKKKRRVAESL